MGAASTLLLVTHSLDRGGSPISLWNLVRNLKDFQCIVTSEKEGPLRSRYADVSIPVRILPRSGPLELGLLARYVRLLRRERVALIHLNTLTAYYKYPALAARLLGIPVVWFIREDVRQKRCVKLHSWIKRLSTRIVPVSEEIARNLYPEGCPPKLRVIHNGIAADHIVRLTPPLRAQLGVAPTEPLVICVAALEERKRITDLVIGLKRLHEKNVRAHVVCLGIDRSRAQSYRSRVERLAREAGVGAHFHLFGDCPNPAGAVVECDAFALPTMWEGCARSILEAMYVRCPIVTTAVGGNPEMLEHGVHGWLYSPGDVNGLADGLYQILKNRELADRLRLQAYSRVIQQFTLEQHVRKVRDMYVEILANSLATT